MKGDRNMKRFMKKMNEKKGFTLAELLIVVAIIAVLVAVAIPVFTAQLEKSKIATDKANVRSFYAEQVTAYMTDETAGATAYDGPTLQATGASCTISGTFAGDDYTVTYTNTKGDGIVLPGATTP